MIRKTDLKQIIILNKRKIGKIIQYNPLNPEEDNNLRKDIFYFNVQSFSDDERLMSKMLDSPPEWLKNIGDRKSQEEKLCDDVLINIFERFEYKISGDFEGYSIELNK